MFQSTRPRGARPEVGHGLGLVVSFQSTRPRGARRGASQDVSGTMRFQSTRPRGARLVLVGVHVEHLRFQSTRPRGARPETGSMSAVKSGFNPRARAGRDVDDVHRRLKLRQVSIHAPARGATLLFRQGILAGEVSIHAPARGATISEAVP